MEDLDTIDSYQFATLIFTLTLGGAMIANMVFGVFVAKVHNDLLTSREIGKQLNAVKQRSAAQVVELEIKKKQRKIAKKLVD